MESFNLSEVPWWGLSPSPFSILFYLFLTGYALRKILKQKRIQRKREFLAIFTDAILLVGFLVLLLDTLWIIMCALRFGAAYPDSMMQLVYSAGRNIAGLVLCFLLVGRYFTDGTIRFGWLSLELLALNVVFLFAWFFLSPTPAYTDWTFAIRHNYPEATILTSFFISHIIGKSIVASIFYTIWK